MTDSTKNTNHTCTRIRTDSDRASTKASRVGCAANASDVKDAGKLLLNGSTSLPTSEELKGKLGWIGGTVGKAARTWDQRMCSGRESAEDLDASDGRSCKRKIPEVACVGVVAESDGCNYSFPTTR